MEEQKSNNDEWMLLESKCNALLSDQLFVKQQQRQEQKQSLRGRNGPRRLLLLGRKDNKVNTKKQKQKQQQKSPSGNKESLSEVLSIVNDLRVLAAAKKGGRCAGGGGDDNQTVLSEPLPLPQLQQQQQGGGSIGRYTRMTATGGVVSREKRLDESQRQYRGRNGRNINTIEPPSRMLQQRGSSSSNSRRNIRSESPMVRRGNSERNINNNELRPLRSSSLQRGSSDRNVRKGGSVMSRDKCTLPPRRSVSDAMASRNRFINNIQPLRTTSDHGIYPLASSTITSPTSSSDVEVVLSPRQKYKTIGSDQSVSTLSTTSMSSFGSSCDSPRSVRTSLSSQPYRRSLSSGSSSGSSGSRRVSFSRHPITEVRTRPFTPEEEIPFLFYSQEDTDRFREENDRRRKALSDSSVVPNVPLPKREEGYDEEAAQPASSGNATTSSSSSVSKFDSTLSPPPRRKRTKDRKSWHALLRKGRSQPPVA